MHFFGGQLMGCIFSADTLQHLCSLVRPRSRDGFVAIAPRRRARSVCHPLWGRSRLYLSVQSLSSLLKKKGFFTRGKGQAVAGQYEGEEEKGCTPRTRRSCSPFVLDRRAQKCRIRDGPSHGDERSTVREKVSGTFQGKEKGVRNLFGKGKRCQRPRATPMKRAQPLVAGAVAVHLCSRMQVFAFRSQSDGTEVTHPRRPVVWRRTINELNSCLFAT